MQQKLNLIKEPDFSTKRDAFQFQQQAVNTLKDLEYGAIFHEQGLGKTKIAIDIFLHWLKKKEIDTVLVIVKKTLVHNWKREIKFHTNLEPLVITENKENNNYSFIRKFKKRNITPTH